MTRTTSRGRRVATAVPLALVSAAWTTHLAGAGPAAPGTAAATVPPVRSLPDGTRVPSAPIDYPASLSSADTVLGAGDQQYVEIAVRPSPGDIPASVLAAYQRAETVINAADRDCGLSWQLIAAIGRVESDHGRFGGATIDQQGVVAPAIIGPVLDGSHGTALISDTDGGLYDGDRRHDRAVGPMQFIPSTWAVVGVDADNDGQRNPQDVDDAALATAVYLCSGTEDLSDPAGQRTAVLRYNHSDAYVELVLAITASYLEGDFGSVPDPVIAAGVLAGGDVVGPLVALESSLRSVPAAPVAGVDEVAPAVEPGLDAVEPAPVKPDPVKPEPVKPDPVKPEPVKPEPVVEEPEPEPEPEPTPEPTPDPEPEPEPQPEPAPEPEPEPEPRVGTMTPEQAAEHCAQEGHVDDLSDDLDPYDLCLLENTAPQPEPGEPALPQAPVADVATTGRHQR